jgi:hypothetical protein
MKYENFKSWIEKYHIFIFVKFNHCTYCNTNMDELTRYNNYLMYHLTMSRITKLIQPNS